MRWFLTLKHAAAVAKNSKRLLMVHLYTDMSGTAQRILEFTCSDPRVVEASRKFVPVRLNLAREGLPMLDKYKIVVNSAILFLQPDGKLVHQIGGFHDPRSLLVEMGKASGAARDRSPCLAALKKNPADGDAAARLAAIYTYELDINRAIASLATAEKSRQGNSSNLMAEAYNAIGDYYQMRFQYPKAIGYFRHAVQAGSATT